MPLILALLGILSGQSATAAERKPSILIIWGDDIGQFNISAYNLGMMGGRPREGQECGWHDLQGSPRWLRPWPGAAWHGPWPRQEFIYRTDDGSVAALRYSQWKMVFLEQRAHGFDVWQEPFVALRLPKLFKLRIDPFERADKEG